MKPIPRSWPSHVNFLGRPPLPAPFLSQAEFYVLYTSRSDIYIRVAHSSSCMAFYCWGRGWTRLCIVPPNQYTKLCSHTESHGSEMRYTSPFYGHTFTPVFPSIFPGEYR